jgi:putative ABC transport system permease protein
MISRTRRCVRSTVDRNVFVNFVTPDWFAAYGTSIRAGRDVDSRDTTTAAPIVLINEAFVRAFFPNRNALGQTVHVRFRAAGAGEPPVQRTVVGIVADAGYRSVREDIWPTMFVPLGQMDFPFPMSTVSIGVQSAMGSPLVLTRSIAALMAVDQNVTFSFRPLVTSVAPAALFDD